MNILAILVASVAAFIIAFLWNGPVFGKIAAKLATDAGAENQVRAPKLSQILLNYLVFLLTAVVMAGVFWIAFQSPVMGERAWFRGVVMAAWLWLGFVITTTSIEVIWKGRSYKLWLFEGAASLVVFAVMGAILAAWPTV